MANSVYFKGVLELSRPLSSHEYADLHTKIRSDMKGKPTTHCGWCITHTTIAWDESDGFHSYLPWLQYLLDHFEGSNIAVNGSIQWTGYDVGDCGVLSVRDNVVHVHYDPPS